MDHERAAHTKLTERSRHQLRHARVVNADDLRGGSCWIRERSEQIEYRARLQLAPGGHGVPRCRMHRRRKKKSDADFFDRTRDPLGREVNPRTKLLEHVG